MCAQALARGGETPHTTAPAESGQRALPAPELVYARDLFCQTHSTAMADAEPAPASSSAPLIYDPKPSLRYASAVALQAAGIGAFVSAVQNALGTHTAGASGFLTRTGGTIGFFGACSTLSTVVSNLLNMTIVRVAAMGATFAFTESFVGNTRQKDDALNGVAGGCAAGFLAGIRGASG